MTLNLLQIDDQRIVKVILVKVPYENKVYNGYIMYQRKSTPKYHGKAEDEIDTLILDSIKNTYMDSMLIRNEHIYFKEGLAQFEVYNNGRPNYELELILHPGMSNMSTENYHIYENRTYLPIQKKFNLYLSHSGEPLKHINPHIVFEYDLDNMSLIREQMAHLEFL